MRPAHGPRVPIETVRPRSSLLTVLGLAACATGADAPRADDARIVGGVRVDIEEHPHQVSVQTAYGHRCGGSIVDERWVLTAAHCVEDFPATLAIVAGITRLSAGDRGDGQRVGVARVVLHPGYAPHSTPPHDDFALLRLQSALDLSGSEVAAIPLVGPDEVAAGWTDPGVLATVTGWGALHAGGALPDALRAVDVPIVSRTAAAEAYGAPIGSDQIAAGWLARGAHDACEGDSGGPLVVYGDDGDPVLAGVVSWGAECGQPEVPGIYARVSHASAWIETTLAEADAEVWVCADDELLCDESWCIPWEWTCDGAADCDDETDEADC